MANPAFWDKIARKYAASPVKDVAAYEDTLARARTYLKPDDHLLEVGCGTGTTAIKLAPAVRQVTATDISGEMVAIAQAKITPDAPRNVRFVTAEIMEPLPDAPFDAICAFNILHLVDDLDAALAHLYGQLKPGGHLISKTGCLGDMNTLIMPLIGIMRFFGKAPAVLRLDAQGLEAAFVRAGFAVVEAGHFGKATATRFVVARKPE